MKPRIMLIQPNFFVYGGAERQIVNMCNYLTQHDFLVTIITQNIVPEMRRDLIDTRFIETGDINNLVNTCKVLMRKFDIINPHNHPAELFLMPNRIPIVWQCNEPPESVLRNNNISVLEREAVRKYISNVVVISDFDKKRFKDIYGIEPMVNYPGVRYDYFSKKVTPKDKYGIKDNFVIIEAGYITWTKNQIKAVEILSEIKKQISNAKLVLAGWDKDSYANKVKDKIKELNLKDDVIITGYIENDGDMRDLYNLSDVLIGPYLKQGGWATTFEALVTGIPIIVSKHFPGAEIVERNNLGITTDIDNFTSMILKTHDNLEHQKKSAKEASKWIKNNLTWDKFSERYAKLFEEIYNENKYSNNNH